METGEERQINMMVRYAIETDIRGPFHFQTITELIAQIL